MIAKRITFGLTLVLSTLLWNASLHAQGESSAEDSFGWQVGQLLPDLELPRIDGKGSFQLSSLRGQRFLLIQFASW